VIIATLPSREKPAPITQAPLSVFNILVRALATGLPAKISGI